MTEDGTGMTEGGPGQGKTVENDVHNFWKIKYLSVSLRSAIVPKRPTMSVKVLINN